MNGVFFVSADAAAENAFPPNSPVPAWFAAFPLPCVVPNAEALNGLLDPKPEPVDGVPKPEKGVAEPVDDVPEPVLENPPELPNPFFEGVSWLLKCMLASKSAGVST